jgi:hypothetical protein
MGSAERAAAFSCRSRIASARASSAGGIAEDLPLDRRKIQPLMDDHSVHVEQDTADRRHVSDLSPHGVTPPASGRPRNRSHTILVCIATIFGGRKGIPGANGRATEPKNPEKTEA